MDIIGVVFGAIGLAVGAWAWLQMRTAQDRNELAWRRERDAATADLEAQRAALTKERAELLSMSPDQLRELALQRAAADFEPEIAAMERQATQDLEEKARNALLNVMERIHVPYVVESTTAVVALPSEDVKGRIIGREGRNIRAFEQVAGVDLLIDDSPTTVAISCFDPVRREIARLALLNLIVDGRIHPGRIEELHREAEKSMAEILADAGREAADRAGIPKLPKKVLDAMGRLRFRAAMGQNTLDHSVETAHLAAMLAAELRLDERIARTAGFLHDIGKGLGTEYPGPHALVGKQFLESCGIEAAIAHAVGAHHREIEPNTPEAQVVIIADGLSASRPGARRDSLEGHTKRLAALEALVAGMEGVDRAVVVQGGREIRVAVRPESVDDHATRELAKAIARRIEKEMDYPGQIQVVVIRETRAIEVAQ